MRNLSVNTLKQFRNLLDEVAVNSDGIGPASAGNGLGAGTCALGPSVGDDAFRSPRDMTVLGPSVGDDNFGVGFSSLGPSVGDDFAPSPGNVTVLGPSMRRAS